MKYVIRNAEVVNPFGTIEEISIENGFFTSDSKNATVIDATGLVVIPGMIDMHAHLREPGQTHKETIATGLSAAAKGGFTGVACMPNTTPVIDSAKQLKFLLQKSAEAGGAKLYPIAAVTKGSLGEELTDFVALKSAGAVAFSDDGRPVADSNIMREALEMSKATDSLLISHAEDLSLVNGGVMNEGKVSAKLGLPGTTRGAEDCMTARDLVMRSIYGGRLHLAHVSTKGALKMVEDVKRAGMDVSCETCPHYFTATDELVETQGALAKVNPPLRTRTDVAAVKTAIAHGTVDVIATDHAPHHAEEKAKGMQDAPCGISGFESAFSLMYELVLQEVISIERLVKLTSLTPAKLLGIPGGEISPGLPANLTIFDPNATYEFNDIISMGKNTPFLGRTMRGRIMYTIVDGEIVYKYGNK